MKVRLITALAGLLVLLTALLLFPTPVPNILISMIAVVAVLEVLGATGCRKSRAMTWFSVTVAALIPFMSYGFFSQLLFPIGYVFAAALFSCLLSKRCVLRLEEMALSFLFSIWIPASLGSLLFYREYETSQVAIAYILVSFGSGWLGDTCAYFVGRGLGRHKLAPEISPNKTVEGAVGGVVGATVLLPLMLLGYEAVCGALGAPVEVHCLRVALVTPVLAILGIFGDLSASIIKRQYGVKDFGFIMPGHGGVMDRFDSVLMIAPVVYFISSVLPLAQ